MLDFACVAMLLTLGIAADSLTNLAEGIRGGLMTLVDLVTLTVLRRLHRGTLAGFDFGTGKIEQLVSIGIALSLLGGALWVGIDAVETALTGHSDATPLGLSLAAVSGAINFFTNVVAWENVRQATRGRPSAIMRAQLRARTTKLFCSVVVQVTMTIAAVAKDPVIVAAAELGGRAPGLRRDGLGGVGARDPRRARPARPLDRPHRRAGARARRRRAARRFFPGKLPLARHAARHWCSKWRWPARPAPTWRWPSAPSGPWQRHSRWRCPRHSSRCWYRRCPRPPSRAAVTAVGVGGS